MEQPSRSTIFRQMMKIRKEQNTEVKNKKETKLPVHKRRIEEKQEEVR